MLVILNFTYFSICVAMTCDIMQTRQSNKDSTKGCTEELIVVTSSLASVLAILWQDFQVNHKPVRETINGNKQIRNMLLLIDMSLNS